MTARAGDALSHVYFGWPASRFSKPISAPISQPIFKRRSRRISSHDFAACTPPEQSASLKLNGSTRICMGAMRDPKGPNPVPLRLLGSDFVSIREHFVYQ